MKKRKRQDLRRNTVAVRLSDKECDILDDLRGRASSSTYLRKLIKDTHLNTTNLTNIVCT